MRRQLDTIDFKIIKALQENARLSNKELAARVHLSPSSCLERSRRLKEAGVLERFSTHVNAKAIGISLQAMIAVKLERHSQATRESFCECALGLEEVVSLYHLTGINDFLIHVAVRDTEHLRQLIVNELSTCVALERLETSMILDETRRTLPILATDDPRPGKEGSDAKTLEFRERSVDADDGESVASFGVRAS